MIQESSADCGPPRQKCAARMNLNNNHWYGNVLMIQKHILIGKLEV